MSNLNEIKENVQKAWDVKHGATGVYRMFKDAVTTEESQIRANRNLSDEGRRVMVAKFKERKTVEAMKLAASQIGLYQKYLEAAYQEADKIAFAKLPKADPIKEERFDKAFAELKTQIMLARPAKAAEILSEFVQSTDDQALVDKIRADFSSTIQPIIGNADEKVKTQFADLFDHTKVKARGPESVEAEEILEQVQAMAESKFFVPIVVENVAGLSQNAAKYINNPVEYFEEFPQHVKMKTDLRSEEEVILESQYSAE